MSDLPNLSDALDDEWAQRLWRRGEQPGVVRLAQAQATAVRHTQHSHLPLADEVARRYAAVLAQQQQLPPIVFAQPAAVVAHGSTVNPLVARPLVVSPLKVSQRPSSAQTDDHAPDYPSPAESAPGGTAVTFLPPPIVRAQLPTLPLANRSTNRTAIQPANRGYQDKKAVRPTAVSPSPLRVQEGASAGPTAPPTSPLPVVQTTRPPFVPASKASPVANGRTAGHTALPIAREHFNAAFAPVPPSMSQPHPLPLAQPMAGVIQRTAQETAVNRPSPTPNRVVSTAGVVQRTAQAGTAVIQRQDETDAVPATDEPIDMDELVDKVHRRFLRRLVVEGERRGKTSWP